MIDQEFEGPLFKVLPRNDTGQGVGHQAGFLIPRELRPFFPALPAPTTAQPVPSISLRAILVLDDGAPRSVTTNYQLQTWGLTRRETRITGNLQYIRDPASRGDLLLIERGRIDPAQFRLTILRRGTALYGAAIGRTGGKPWGILREGVPAATQAELATAIADVEARTLGAFEPFEDDAALQSVSKRIARCRAFRSAVVAAYGERCGMCGGGARSPSGASEIEAAHVIPRALKGSDDIRNGIALCRLHHWAFDQQLVGFTAAGQLRVAAAAAAMPDNAAIAALDGQALHTPTNPAHHIHQDAVAWSVAAFDRYWMGQP